MLIFCATRTSQDRISCRIRVTALLRDGDKASAPVALRNLLTAAWRVLERSRPLCGRLRLYQFVTRAGNFGRYLMAVWLRMSISVTLTTRRDPVLRILLTVRAARLFTTVAQRIHVSLMPDRRSEPSAASSLNAPRTPMPGRYMSSKAVAALPCCSEATSFIRSVLRNGSPCDSSSLRSMQSHWNCKPPCWWNQGERDSL